MRSLFITLLFNAAVASFAQNSTAPDSPADDKHFTQYLTTSDFLSKVVNYKESREWKYLGTRPCVIDFYATWCGPCRAIAPSLEELAEEYQDKVTIYKVDVDKEKELAAVFGIRSIPTLLLVPMADQPQVIQGAYPKDALKELINVIVLGQKPQNLKMWQSQEEGTTQP
ncbi:MAG: thioredoxin [Bacteroidales bacterium]|nr:thioredoxin [Bacteroidales bacterium]